MGLPHFYYKFYEWAEKKIDSDTEPLVNEHGYMNFKRGPWEEFHERTPAQLFLIDIVRIPFWLQNKLRNLYSSYLNQRAKYWLKSQLRSAREIYFYGEHINVEGLSTWEDVSVGFTGRKEDARFLFMLTTMKDVEYWIKDAWERGEITASHGGEFVIGEDYFTRENIERACRAWYVEQIEWMHGHFAHTEGLPKITCDFEVKTLTEMHKEDPDNYPSPRGYKKQLRESEASSKKFNVKKRAERNAHYQIKD